MITTSLALYLGVGIILYALWPKYAAELKALYFFAFPVHWCLLSYANACLRHKGRFLDNPIWWLALAALAGGAMCGL